MPSPARLLEFSGITVKCVLSVVPYRNSVWLYSLRMTADDLPRAAPSAKRLRSVSDCRPTAAARRAQARPYAHDRRARRQRPGQHGRPDHEHLAARRLADDRRDGVDPPGRRCASGSRAASCSRPMARPSPGGRAPSCSNCARPIGRSPSLRTGRGGSVFMGTVDGALDRTRRAGDQADPAALSQDRDQHPGRHERRAGQRTARLAPRLHHRPHPGRPESAAVREPDDRHRAGLSDRPARPSADGEAGPDRGAHRASTGSSSRAVRCCAGRSSRSSCRAASPCPTASSTRRRPS